MKNLFFIVFLIILSFNAFGQLKDYELGSSNLGRYQSQGGFFDYSDPKTVNIKVSLWGFVKFPGRYTVPINTTLLDLLSYAGGPLIDANLNDIRLYKGVNEGGAQEDVKIIKYDYDALLWNNEKSIMPAENPTLEAGDVVIMPGEPKYFFRDNLSMWLSVVSALISLSILVLNIVRK